jgi:Na+-translocating ferredoxin:NAD+ oxidoreductase RnfC subunit
MLDRLRLNGVVGCGGAGFPTYKKLERAVDTVVMNAAECEPLLHKDQQILHHHQALVLEGMARVMKQVGAATGLIAIKEKHEELSEELARAGKKHGIEVRRLGDFYPAGDEFVTVYETTGRLIPPGGLPGDVGCVVVNVETLLNLQLDSPVTHKYLTVGGEVEEPVTLRVPIGAPFGEVLRAAGVDPEEVGGVLIGGVMMGRPMENPEEPVTRTTGGLLCFPPDHGLLERYRTDARTRSLIGKSACDQCRFCTELCPRYLLGHPVEPHLAMRSLVFDGVSEEPVPGSQFCSGCNLCSLYACPEGLYPREACLENREAMQERGLDHPARGRADLPAHGMQPFRRIPVTSLIKKLGLGDFSNRGPLVEREWPLARVRIPLQMHVGAPATAVVARGDRVRAGQVIGAAPDGLGVAVHASIDGEVVSVSGEVEIRSEGEGESS